MLCDHSVWRFFWRRICYLPDGTCCGMSLIREMCWMVLVLWSVVFLTGCYKYLFFLVVLSGSLRFSLRL